VYQIDGMGVSAAGVVADVSVEAYRDGRIKRYEHTLTATEDLPGFCSRWGPTPTRCR